MPIILQNLQAKIPINQKIIDRALKQIEKLKFFKNHSFSVALVPDAAIKKLNRDYHKINAPTDVLSFEINPPYKKRKSQENFNGDVIISADTAKKNAKIYKKTLEEEILLYIIHGMLHLTGFDDTTKIKAKKMQLEQEKILNKIWL